MSAKTVEDQQIAVVCHNIQALPGAEREEHSKCTKFLLGKHIAVSGKHLLGPHIFSWRGPPPQAASSLQNAN